MRGRTVVRQNDFAFGELSPEHAASGDKDSVSRSLQKGRDIRLLNSFGFKQRFGSRHLRRFGAFEHCLTTAVASDGNSYIVAMRASTVDFFDKDGTLIQTVSGTPWATLDEVKATTRQPRVDELYVAHQSYPTQVFTRDPGTGIWSLADYAFAEGPGGSKLQIYHRYAAKGITLQPSALTGTVNVTFSADVLDASHVGVIFRYGVVDGTGQELQIATVVDAQHGTATVLNELPPTVTVTVGSGSGFHIGEEVKGATTEATGFIVGISGADITILMTRGFQSFDDTTVNDADHDGTPDSGEYLIGAYTRSYITVGSKISATPAATVAWDEAAISPVHGYPGAVFERSGRLGFTNFPGIPCGIALSAPDTTDDFDIGTGGAGDAIFEILEESGQAILRAVSAANLLLLTTQAAYYVPEGTDVPLSALTFAVVKIGPAGIGDSNPAVVDEGVVYVERGGNRIIALLSTGSLTAPWKLVDISRQASHLISNPASIAVTSGSTQAAERYVMVLNDDGTVAVLFFDEAPARLGWVLWTADNGQYTSMTTIDGFLYTNCNRTFADTSVWSFLERFDADAQLDCSTTITLPGGTRLDLAGETIAVTQGTKYLGTFPVAVDGTVTGLSGTGDFETGYHFTMDATLWPPEPDGDDRVSFSERHIGRVAVRVQETQSFAFGIANQGQDYTVPVYMDGDNQAVDPPLRSNWFRRSFLGWQKEPNVHIRRPIPQPVQILAVAMEVAF